MLGKKVVTPSNGARAAIATQNSSTVYSASGKTENKRWFQASGNLRGDSGADGLVAPVPCTAYFGKLAKLFGCSLPQQALA